MSPFKKFLYYFLFPAALIYSGLSILFYIFSYFTAEDAATRDYALLLILLFIVALVIALVSLIFRTKLGILTKTVIHFAILAGLFGILLSISGEAFSTSSKWILFAIFVFAYLIIAIPCVIYYSSKKKKENSEKEYTSAFKK